jgi:hypothetical protein
MTDTKKAELEPNDKKLVEIPEESHPPIAHVSTPLDGPKGMPETESDEGEKA